jgi:hypothetical protein
MVTGVAVHHLEYPAPPGKEVVNPRLDRIQGGIGPRHRHWARRNGAVGHLGGRDGDLGAGPRRKKGARECVRGVGKGPLGTPSKAVPHGGVAWSVRAHAQSVVLQSRVQTTPPSTGELQCCAPT